MKRREFVAGAVSVACAGVVGASRADEFEGWTGSRPDRLDGAGGSGGAGDGDGADDGNSAGGSDGVDANASDETGGGDGARPPASTLQVLSKASGTTPARLRLVRADGVVVHDEVREFAYGERAHLSGLMDRGETYRFELAIDGATLVRETVSPGERAVFELVDESTVSVVA